MAAEAAEVLKAAKHKGPIKVIWTREDDIKGGRYRPVIRPPAEGRPRRRRQHRRLGPGHRRAVVHEGEPLREGHGQGRRRSDHGRGREHAALQVPNLRVSAHIVEVGVSRRSGGARSDRPTPPMRPRRSSISSPMRPGIDPLAVRRKLLGKHPRHLAVLNRAAEAADWEKPLPKGKARGLAVHKSVQLVTWRTWSRSRSAPTDLPKVERVVCAADCGIAINPDVIKAQLEGGMGYGLSAALYGAIDLENGRVAQSNFDDYRVLRDQRDAAHRGAHRRNRPRSRPASASRVSPPSRPPSPMPGPS